MCLVLALTNMKKIKLAQCLNNIGNTLLKSEKDGFGYAVQGQGGVFGEKTINRRFRTRFNRINFVSLPIIKRKYSSFGQPTELVGPGVFHGRTSTNRISLRDTHPMQLEGWSLIHNGVVDDLGPKYDKHTANDSEDVLRRLLDGVGTPNPMAVIEKTLEGYYAFAAIDPQGRLHIGRDDIAPLHIAWSAKLDTYLIGTTEGLILKVSKILDAKIGPIDEIESETYCIFEGNELIHSQDFKALGFAAQQAKHASRSLRRELPPKSGGEVIDVSSERVASESGWPSVPQDQWQDSIVDFLNTDYDGHHRQKSRASEDDYYQYKREVEAMDASYQIYTVDDKPITLSEFRKMDYVSQELCTIIRADGTVVDAEDYGTPRLRGTR